MEMSERVVAAKMRFEQALKAVGPDNAGILIDAVDVAQYLGAAGQT